ncbi:hypothetical protein BKA70DRAFT_1311472 [Coprinopsis sp. MPI-PUGE-AT-0042]|nr:hypothetical protein BKA70DRAFT_1311472 [Coprinopsis sp. MPI-PUGE-AT-0042]
MAPSSPPNEQQQIVLACAYPHCTTVRVWNSSSMVSVLNCGCHAPICDGCIGRFSGAKGRYSCTRCEGGWDFQGLVEHTWPWAFVLHRPTFEKIIEKQDKLAELKTRVERVRMARFVLASVRVGELDESFLPKLDRVEGDSDLRRMVGHHIHLKQEEESAEVGRRRACLEI